MTRLYRNQKEFELILDAIKNEIYRSISKEIRPSKEEFDSAFGKTCSITTVVKILTQIEDSLGSKISGSLF